MSSATCISMRSFRIVSLIAIVPDSECRMPILIVSSAAALSATLPSSNADATVAVKPRCRVSLHRAFSIRKVAPARRVSRAESCSAPAVRKACLVAAAAPRATAEKCDGTGRPAFAGVAAPEFAQRTFRLLTNRASAALVLGKLARRHAPDESSWLGIRRDQLRGALKEPVAATKIVRRVDRRFSPWWRYFGACRYRYSWTAPGANR